MFPSRSTLGPSTGARKSKIDGKPSMLPKPRRPFSTDRTSTEARQTSAAPRSSSAEPSRSTVGGGRLSRESSASKIPLHRRSNSQQGHRHLQSSMTPLRSSQLRPTTTPVKTPSEDRQSRMWQACVDRALGFITIKDQRPIASAAWQRAEFARVQAALASLELEGAGATLIRPLTIARFADITNMLLGTICGFRRDNPGDGGKVKIISNDNYVTKLPNLAKRFLYPGTVSKSWLKTVNTLHAFPHALAFIGYFLDLLNHITAPVSNEWLYVNKDDVSCLRRDYVSKCWRRFQECADFEDLEQEYLQSLKHLLGDNEQKVAQLQDTIDKCQATLEDKSEEAARAEEESVRARLDQLVAAKRAVHTERVGARTETNRLRALSASHAAAARALDHELATLTEEVQQVEKELEEQSISVEERTRQLDELDYAVRVIDSKRTLADQLQKMVSSKEAELALWQKRTLDSCVEYKQGIIHLSAKIPELAALAIDEQALMEPECASAMERAVETLRAHAARLADERAEHTRARAHHTRQRAAQIEETRAQISELKESLKREQHARAAADAAEAAEAAAWATQKAELSRRMDVLRARQHEYDAVRARLDYWEPHATAWRTKLSEMDAYMETLRDQVPAKLEAAKKRRADALHATLDECSRALACGRQARSVVIHQ